MATRSTSSATKLAALAAKLKEIQARAAPAVVVLTRWQRDAPDALDEEIARAEASGSLVVIVCKEEAPPRWSAGPTSTVIPRRLIAG